MFDLFIVAFVLYSLIYSFWLIDLFIYFCRILLFRGGSNKMGYQVLQGREMAIRENLWISRCSWHWLLPDLETLSVSVCFLSVLGCWHIHHLCLILHLGSTEPNISKWFIMIWNWVNDCRQEKACNGQERKMSPSPCLAALAFALTFYRSLQQSRLRSQSGGVVAMVLRVCCPFWVLTTSCRRLKCRHILAISADPFKTVQCRGSTRWSFSVRSLTHIRFNSQ